MRQPDKRDHAGHAERGDPTLAPAPAIICPFCGAADAELLSLFGSQLLTEQYYCRACHTPFERIKDDETADAICGV